MKNKVRNCIQSNKTQGQREGEAGRMLIKAGKMHHDVLFSSELSTETLLFCWALWHPLHSHMVFTLRRHRCVWLSMGREARENPFSNLRWVFLGPPSATPQCSWIAHILSLIHPKKLRSSMFSVGLSIVLPISVLSAVRQAGSSCCKLHLETTEEEEEN